MPKVRSVEFVLLAALGISLPSLIEAFDGAIGIATAFVRVAIAIVVCACGGAIIERVIDVYSRQARQKELQARIEVVLRARAAQFGAQGDSRHD